MLEGLKEKGRKGTKGSASERKALYNDQTKGGQCTMSATRKVEKAGEK